jgi:hypothetical protein
MLRVKQFKTLNMVVMTISLRIGIIEYSAWTATPPKREKPLLSFYPQEKFNTVSVFVAMEACNLQLGLRIQAWDCHPE